MKRSLTGIRASGNLHLGNYLGTIREGIKLQDSYECLYFIADMHALTTTKDPEALRKSSYDIVAAWMACGLDTDKHIMYRQSDIPAVAEFAWYLSCVTGMGYLQKAHSYKDAIANKEEVNHGVFAYPLLMAADILMYAPDIVPVGKDQKQHVEMARNMAGSFNATYDREILKLPQPLINDQVMTIPGLDGRKMSKSYRNEIPLFCSEKELKKKVMSLTTDSTGLEDSKELRGSTLGELYQHFASKSDYRTLDEKLAGGGYGWGHAKQDLFEAINDHLKEYRKKYNTLRADEAELDRMLARGRERALAIGFPILNRVREAQGFCSA